MSVRAELLRAAVRILLKSRTRHFDVGKWRRTMQATEKLVPRPPARAGSSEISARGLNFHRMTMPASRITRHILYLHGGAYVAGSPRNYHHFTWRLADALAANVWALSYRLAPEHPFPAALEDAACAYAFLADTTPEQNELFVMGDSAGGGLALALLLKLRDEGKALPRAAVALSPWTDLALTGASLVENAARDPMLTAHQLPEIARFYVGDADPRNPYVSPLYGDTAGLPPVLIQSGQDEILHDDAVRMAEKLSRNNPRSRIEIWPRMMHCWQLFAPVLPEARVRPSRAWRSSSRPWRRREAERRAEHVGEHDRRADAKTAPHALGQIAFEMRSGRIVIAPRIIVYA
jgi:acetyl esterase/lipase